ncbi:MAG: hypothetical protein ABT940_08235 [Alphaproteobacteria bacterium]
MATRGTGVDGRWKTGMLAVMMFAAWGGEAPAQTMGGSVAPLSEVPVYEAPPRDGQVLAPPSGQDAAAQAAREGARLEKFRTAYQGRGRPRLAIFWNREFGDTLAEWYGDERVKITRNDGFNLTGDHNQSGTTSGATLVENQHRIASGSARAQPTESWTWEFQDGFLAPLLQAGAVVVDRAAIARFTAIKSGGAEAPTVEATSLQNMADYLVEVLMAPQALSTTGFELHARVIDTRTGQLLSQVNSRSMEGWEPREEYVATEHGYFKPDEDNQRFGPEDQNRRYKAGPDGYTRQHKPPKLRKVALQLSYNVMDGMTNAWMR